MQCVIHECLKLYHLIYLTERCGRNAAHQKSILYYLKNYFVKARYMEAKVPGISESLISGWHSSRF